MILTNIMALKNNYIWILYDKNNSCIIIDPGESKIVIKEIIQKKWNPKAILLTHNHVDHTNGVENILKKYPKIIVFGPEETKNFHVNEIIKGGDKINLLEYDIDIISTPGHTLGHISYYLKPYLFCGDTLFSAGCGKVFKNNYIKMYNSIQSIKLFPNNTVLCCAHEYTVSNLIFSMHFLPQDKNIKCYYKKIQKKIFLKKNIFPFFLNHEKKINIFLRTDEFFLKKSMGFKKSKDSFEIFCYLRKIKDIFGAKRD
ncbi:hydroxyacylglutathione hydrolase [Buchnera aphidicola (Aphis glycines)]|uniref:Hydroxyacylglutathione hydrolase n=1 Tax=Buchnera aphidicola (Aphis glycines) TaxID=1265350 RepID=A0A0M4H402_9GAMM|nr:hydroxyacylglutathione hydrolase [Buchnera aphidicola]ALD15525.1 hydroxyacylglutathione hydrolase [Buchnera aphidicola (Aphis glycines)]